MMMDELVNSEEKEEGIHLMMDGIGAESFRLTSKVLKNLQKCRLPKVWAILEVKNGQIPYPSSPL